MSKHPRTHVMCPFTIVIDSNEGAPYDFQSLHAPSKQQFKPLIIKTARKPLWSMHQKLIEIDGEEYKVGLADYSIDGWEECIQIERKSLNDLYTTLGQRRGRFEAEIKRLNECEFALVVIEADWRQIERGVLESKVYPASVCGTIAAWMQRYPNVHWQAMGGRRSAEKMVFRTLERFWRDREAR